MEGQEKNMQKPRPYGVHTFHVKNVNRILASKGTKTVPKISFQLTIDIGKKKANFFFN
jgi:Na+-transporting NADH:ubiquinone oxidoreductase subunit NqrA